MKGASKPKAHGAKARKERDEDLLLFREMFKREKERNVASLLDPVSSEFESSQGEYIKLNFVCCSTTKFVSWEIIRFKTSNCNKYYYFDY